MEKMVSFEKAPEMELTRYSLDTPCFYVYIFIPWSSAATWIYLCDKARQGGITSLVSQHNTVWHNKQHNTTLCHTVCQRGITSLVWQQQKLPKTVAHLVGRQSFTFDTTFSQLWQNITEITHKVGVCVTNTTMKPNDTDLFSPCEVTGVRKPPLLSTEQNTE